jgi:predicted RNase H-like HicB family nuclease
MPPVPRQRLAIADVPDLAHSTAHGPTPHDAVAQVEIAIEAWLEAARGDGQPLPEPSPRAAQA